MSNHAELMLLCKSLVANEFAHISDAEQALEQFEKLTTPAAVLGLIAQVVDLKTKTSAWFGQAGDPGWLVYGDGQSIETVSVMFRAFSSQQSVIQTLRDQQKNAQDDGAPHSETHQIVARDKSN